ncbi:MAG: hypothetical protein K0B14_17080, partial [Anaerolineaceae bacterium]|nr:hypothetical protein [Anaerolineaceae bacterium]
MMDYESDLQKTITILPNKKIIVYHSHPLQSWFRHLLNYDLIDFMMDYESDLQKTITILPNKT